MSVEVRPKRLSVTQIQSRKGAGKLVCLTAYTASVARLIDHEVDVLLVGDSLAMTVYGFDSTLPVTLDMMIAHGAAVVRSTEHALIVVDLPFGSYQASPDQAFRAAARVLAETGCAAVKLEGGEEMAETVAFLTRRGVPVMGHVGLTPQSVNALGGYRSRGHAAGDRMLVAVANTLGAALRSYDLIIRYGGDEFVCTMSGLNMVIARKRFALINTALAKAAEQGSVTVGLAELQPNDSAKDLVARADAALYRERQLQRSTGT